MSQHSQLQHLSELVTQLPIPAQSAYLSWIERLSRRLQQQLPIDKSLKQLSRQLTNQLSLYRTRLEQLPEVNLNQALPIFEKRNEIVAMIRSQQVLIIAGETGSGKTTQIPQLCLNAGLGVTGMIGHTQPRRIAATAVASRIADELRCELGHEVGYQIRFDKQLSDSSYIKLMTDGVLLNELHEDPLLLKYEIIIVDEAHERSLNIDFIFGVMKQIISKRPDFKLIITSATIDVEKFSKHFNDAPIIEVSGRTFPVEIRYRPDSFYPETDSFEGHALMAVRELSREGRGDILIFLPSEQAIRHLADYLRRHLQQSFDILPLYSRLAKQQQMSIFQPHHRARIVLATNIAETSLTVPGIRYVIDSGLARISRYSTRSKVQRLPIEAISQASANQRAGRCGRTEAGICIRLYSEDDFLQRPEFVEPEILRTNLATVILQMTQLELGAVEQFDFIDPPQQKQINDGIQLLLELQAMEDGRQITPIGRKLARLPVDPRIGRILLAGAELNATREVTIIAAMIGMQDPRERPAENPQKADEFHQRFSSKKSDFMALLNLWDYFHDLVEDMSWTQVRKRCMSEFIHYQRVREWREHVSQLLKLLRDLGYSVAQHKAADYDSIHRALLSGYLTQVANYDPRGYYLAPRQVKLHLFPGSGLYRKPKKINSKSKVPAENTETKPQSVPWIMAAEWVETSKNFARLVAEIKPDWIESYAESFLKKQQSEPFWSSKAARAMVKESGLLFGLPIYNNRRISLEQFDIARARELFIEHGLVDRDYRTTSEVIQHNWKIINDVEELQQASRKQDLLASRDWFISFYQKRVPEHITNGTAFDAWVAKLAKAEQQKLRFNTTDICREDIESSRELFPDSLLIKNNELRVEYRFEPGQAQDGMHIFIPLIMLNQLQQADFEWLVPGLFEELVIALIRSLPKAKRKRFVPVPEYARAVMERLDPSLSDGLYQQMASALQKMSGELMSASDFQAQNLADNLCPTFVIIDEHDKVLASSPNLPELQDRYRHKVAQSLQGNEKADVFQTFPQQGFSKSQQIQRGATSLTIHQGLKRTQDGYELYRSPDKDQVIGLHKQALASLALEECQKSLRDMSSHLHELTSFHLIYSTLKSTSIEQPLINTDTLFQDLLLFSLCQLLPDDRIVGSDEPSHRALFKQLQSSALPDAVDLVPALRETMKTMQSIRERLDQLKSLQTLSIASAIRERLDELLYKGFIHTAGDDLIQHYPRYLKGLAQRLEVAIQKPLQERERGVIWDKYWQQYCELSADSKSRDLRQSLEEFHVMIFAQQLGTKKKVSEKRLKQRFAELNRS